jgi:hypothetical protein
MTPLCHFYLAAFSAVNMFDNAAKLLLYPTLEGEVACYDTRAKKMVLVWMYSKKKIGSCHILPQNRDSIAIASFDRTV